MNHTFRCSGILVACLAFSSASSPTWEQTSYIKSQRQADIRVAYRRAKLVAAEFISELDHDGSINIKSLCSSHFIQTDEYREALKLKSRLSKAEVTDVFGITEYVTNDKLPEAARSTIVQIKWSGGASQLIVDAIDFKVTNFIRHLATD